MSVYFATCREANAVKIGSSVDPFGRLPELQMGCPLPITIEAIMHGGIEQEFTYHRRFADDRIRGEWFTITPMIEAVMAASPAPARPRKLVRTVPCPKAAKRKEARRSGRPFYSQANDERASRKLLKNRVAAGDIHFPFRAKEEV